MRPVLLLVLLAVLTFSLGTQNNWAYFFSRQDHIDPQNLSVNDKPKDLIGFFDNQPIPAPLISNYQSNQNHILGETTAEKRIEVDLTNQRLYAYENDQLVFDFIISSGKWDRTPTGTFKVWTKIRSQKMSGGSKELGTYYYLPNVPYILFFYNDQVPKKYGYSLHGTYWHNNFGIPMSHGCINMITEEVAQIFSWAEVGITITIYGKYETKLPSADITSTSQLIDSFHFNQTSFAK